MFFYIEEKNLPIIFKVVYEYYVKAEEVPVYTDFKSGILNLVGVLNGVRADFYPSVTHKAAYLFVQINKGHFFPNGNKRLALVVALVFSLLNGYSTVNYTKEEYRKVISVLFPAFQDFSDFPDLSPSEFALYNLSIIVADSHKYTPVFDELKSSVESFFRLCMNKL